MFQIVILEALKIYTKRAAYQEQEQQQHQQKQHGPLAAVWEAAEAAELIIRTIPSISGYT